MKTDTRESGMFLSANYGPEKYFMAQEDQDAVIGRLVRERRDLQAKLTALETEAKHLGAMLASLGQMLRDYPEQIVFENHPAPAELVGRTPLFKPSAINGPTIVKLIDDLRETHRAVQDIERRGRQFGI